MNRYSRRVFSALSAACATGTLFSSFLETKAFCSAPHWPIHGFSKHFQDLDANELADFANKVGWQGVDLTVRKGGHIPPEEAETLLPKFIKVLRSHGQLVQMITTDIKEAATDSSQRILRVASDNGIRMYRFAYWTYDPATPITQQLDQIRSQLDPIARLNRSLKITGGFQNHSGEKYVGASVWDIWYLLKEFDPREVSMFFDIGHAVIEGGLSWPTDWRLVSQHVAAIYAKDFRWQKTGPSANVEWCEFGQGFVPGRFFQSLNESSWSGPISLHHEYALPNEPLARLEKVHGDTLALRRAFAS